MAATIGFDLPTTNSVVGVMDRGEPRIIDNPEGYHAMRSVIAFTESGKRLVLSLSHLHSYPCQLAQPDRGLVRHPE